MNSPRTNTAWGSVMVILVAAAALAAIYRNSLGNAALAALVASAVWLSIWVLPKRQVDKVRQNPETKGPLELENEYRQTFVQIVCGIAIFVTVYATFDSAKLAHDTLRLSVQSLSLASESYELTRRGQVADRTFKAMDMLSRQNNMDAKEAAVYSLEQVADEDTRSEWPITEILFNYVRVHDKWSAGSGRRAKDPLPPDISAVLDYLRRRPWQTKKQDGKEQCNEYWQCGSYKGNQPEEDDPYYSWRINLPLVDFRNAFLERAMLKGLIIEGAHLERARLSWGVFDGAYAANSNFKDAKLIGSSWRSANLQCADLSGSHWNGADMDRIYLKDAKLFGADLSGVRNLSLRQLAEAQGDISTILSDENLRPPAWSRPSEHKCQR